MSYQSATWVAPAQLRALAFRRQFRAVEIRTVAGPSSAVQWMLSGGPNTV